MSYNLNDIQRIEFFVCLDNDGQENHYQVPIDTDVQAAICEMFKTTFERFNKKESVGEVEDYSPAQKYGNNDAVRCPLDSGFAKIPSELLAENDIEETSDAINYLESMSYYYAKAFDSNEVAILGVRRATHFKGILKARLLKIVSNTLKMVDDKTFKLDIDFDYLAINDELQIIRPSGLEFTAHLTESVKAAAPAAAAFVSQKIGFLNLDSLGVYSSKHPRAARYLAAVKSRDDLDQTSQHRLIKYCKSADVKLIKENGKYYPDKGYEILFLEVLDRRLFMAELIDGKKERYEAPNRRNV